MVNYLYDPNLPPYKITYFGTVVAMGKNKAKENDKTLFPSKTTSRKGAIYKISIFLLVPTLVFTVTFVNQLLNTPRNILNNLVSAHQYYDFTFQGDTTQITKLFSLEPGSISDMHIYVNRPDSTTYILNGNEFMLALNEKNLGIKVSKLGLSNFSNQLEVFLSKPEVGNDLYNKVFDDAYITISGVKKAKVSFPNISKTSKGLLLESNLNTLLALSNLDILLYSLEIVSKQKLGFSGNEIILLELNDDKVIVDLSSLRLGSLKLVGSPTTRKVYLDGLTTEINNFTQLDNKKALETVKNFIALLEESANQISTIDKSLLSTEMLFKAYREVPKDPLLNYQTTETEIKLSYLNICRVIGIQNQIFYVNYC